MEDELETIESVNILRAIPHQSSLPNIPEGHYTLRHEVAGVINRPALERLMEEAGFSEEERRKGFAFHDVLVRKMAKAALAGYIVDDGSTRWASSLNGDVPAERLGHQAHKGEVGVSLSISASGEVAQLANDTGVFIHAALASNAPRLLAVLDALSEERDILYPGKVAELRGNHLTLAGPQQEEIGIYLQAGAQEAPIRIPASQCKPNSPSLIRFVVPATVPPGAYTVTLATRWLQGHKDRFTNEVRTSVYDHIVTIDASP